MKKNLSFFLIILKSRLCIWFRRNPWLTDHLFIFIKCHKIRLWWLITLNCCVSFYWERLVCFHIFWGHSDFICLICIWIILLWSVRYFLSFCAFFTVFWTFRLKRSNLLNWHYIILCVVYNTFQFLDEGII